MLRDVAACSFREPVRGKKSEQWSVPVLHDFYGCIPLFLYVCRDRVSCVWQTVRDHLYHLCVHANESCFLVERAVVGLLRLAIRLLRREEISSQVHQKHTNSSTVVQRHKLHHSWHFVRLRFTI